MTPTTIWKYPLKIEDSFQLEMPAFAVVLSVQVQGETPCIWARVDPKETKKFMRTFRIFGTGHELPSDPYLGYIGTFQLHGGALVFHLFEEMPSHVLSPLS